MARKIIQPAIEFDAVKLENGSIECELSCASCSGTKLTVPFPEELPEEKDIECAACGAIVRLKPAIEECLDSAP